MTDIVHLHYLLRKLASETKRGHLIKIVSTTLDEQTHVSTRITIERPTETPDLMEITYQNIPLITTALFTLSHGTTVFFAVNEEGIDVQLEYTLIPHRLVPGPDQQFVITINGMLVWNHSGFAFTGTGQSSLNVRQFNERRRPTN